MKKLDYADAILILIYAAGGKITGRTAIQKLIYFAAEEKLVKNTFFPHFYGPYSVEVSDSLLSLNSVDFLKEEAEYSELPKSDWKRYSYSLTKRGEDIINYLKEEYRTEFDSLEDLVKKSNDLTHLDIQALSCAAKIRFVLSREPRKSVTFEKIKSMAKSFAWKLKDEQIKKSAYLLQELGWVKLK